MNAAAMIASAPRHALAGSRPGFAPLRAVARWVALRRERAALAALDARLLADIGVSAADAEAEASRPFWDWPANR